MAGINLLNTKNNNTKSTTANTAATADPSEKGKIRLSRELKAEFRVVYELYRQCSNLIKQKLASEESSAASIISVPMTIKSPAPQESKESHKSSSSSATNGSSRSANSLSHSTSLPLSLSPVLDEEAELESREEKPKSWKLTNSNLRNHDEESILDQWKTVNHNNHSRLSSGNGNANGGENENPSQPQHFQGGSSPINSGRNISNNSISSNSMRIPLDIQSFQFPDSASPAIGFSLHSLQYQRLLGEKRSLQVLLNDFERKFLAIRGRPIQFQSDIKPVEAEWARYKRLKIQLERSENNLLQSQTQSHTNTNNNNNNSNYSNYNFNSFNSPSSPNSSFAYSVSSCSSSGSSVTSTPSTAGSTTSKESRESKKSKSIQKNSAPANSNSAAATVAAASKSVAQPEKPNLRISTNSNSESPASSTTPVAAARRSLNSPFLAFSVNGRAAGQPVDDSVIKSATANTGGSGSRQKHQRANSFHTFSTSPQNHSDSTHSMPQSLSHSSHPATQKPSNLVSSGLSSTRGRVRPQSASANLFSK